MGSLVDALFADPLWYIGLVFAFLGALAFLVFLRGFLSGVPHFFTLSTHEEHQLHHRHRVTWGFFSMVILFLIWRVVVWIADLIAF